jgi:hypothetical protein
MRLMFHLTASQPLKCNPFVLVTLLSALRDTAETDQAHYATCKNGRTIVASLPRQGSTAARITDERTIVFDCGHTRRERGEHLWGSTRGRGRGRGGGSLENMGSCMCSSCGSLTRPHLHQSPQVGHLAREINMTFSGCSVPVPSCSVV